MFCQHCGQKASSKEAQFCSSCGKSLPIKETTATKPAEAKTKVEANAEDKFEFELKPFFIPLLVIANVWPQIFFGTIFGTVFGGGLCLAAIRLFNETFPAELPFMFAAPLLFFGIPTYYCFMCRETFSKTIYRFHTSKLHYHEGFLVIEEKTIPYKNITEVSLSKTVFQRFFELGNIYLSTPATGMSGICIVDIKNVDENYKRIKELIKPYQK